MNTRLNRALGGLALVVSFALGASNAAAQADQPVPVPVTPGGTPGGTFDPSKPMTAEPDTSLLARARADPRLSKFVSLVEVAKQESLLQSENATVLAPVNEAFNEIAASEMERLLSPDGAQDLRQLIRCHVLVRLRPSPELGSERRARTYGNRRLLVESNGAGGFIVGGARLVQADVTGSNGIMHLVDRVMLPPPKNLLATLEADPELSTFTKMVKLTGRDVTLSAAQNHTVFAPTNAAFERLSKGVLDNLMKPENLNDLRKVVSRHIVPGMMFVENLDSFSTGGRGLPALSGEPITIEVQGGSTLLNKTVRISRGDIEANYGVLHVTSDMLRYMPWGDEAKPVPSQPIPGETAPGAAQPGAAPGAPAPR